jgi:hypothetical protein
MARIRPNFSLLFTCLVGALFSGTSAVGCGASQPATCMDNDWKGTCSLIALTKIAERELPMPAVSYEALYHPEPNPERPNYSPPDARLNFTVAGRYEIDLKAHLEAQPNRSCSFVPHDSGICGDGELQVDVIPFDAEKIAAREDASQPKGCAKLETTSPSDSGSDDFEERFEFAAQSTELDASLEALADQAAARLKGDTSIECVAIVVGVSSDEKFELAPIRARQLKEALTKRGVEAHRLTTITTMPNYTTGRDAPPPEARDRTGLLRVLLLAE